MQALRREPASFLVLFTESQIVKPWNAVAKLVTSVGQPTFISQYTLTTQGTNHCSGNGNEFSQLYGNKTWP